MKIKTLFSKIVLPQYQVIFFLLTSGIIFFLGSRAIGRFYPLEKFPEIKSVTPEKIKEWGGDPVVVDVGMYISNWVEFKIVENDFIFDGVIWFQFDPAVISLDTIGKFAFEKGEILKKSEPDTKLIEGRLFAEYKIRLKFTTTLSNQFFPLDDHRIYITMTNTFVSPAEMIFRSFQSDFVMSSKIEIPGWRNVDRAVRAGYEEERYDKFDDRKVVRYPSVLFALDFARSGIRLILLIFLPVFLIFFISLFWFGFEPKDSRSIMMLTTSAITSLIAYRFVIQGLSPGGGYFLLSDHIFTFFLAMSFISFVLSLLWISYGKMNTWYIIVRGSIFIIFHLSVIGAWYYLLFLWVKGGG